MKNKLKYAVCAVISVIVTCAVVFLPYFYYNTQDSNQRKTYKVEDFSIETPETDISYDKLYSLLLSGNAIWVNSRESLSNSHLLMIAKDALNELKPYFSDNKYALEAIDTFLINTDISYIEYESSVVSGVIDDIPMSASLLYIKFYTDNSFEITIVIDKKTKKIFQYSIYDVDNVSDHLSFSSEYYDTINKEIDINLNDYWDIEDDLETTIYIEPYGFSFYLFNYDYYILKYNEFIYDDDHIYDSDQDENDIN